MAKVSAPTNRSNSATADPETVNAWEQAQKTAKEAGIFWERPKGDNRSAQDIINDTPLLRDLGNQSGVRFMLEDRVGGDIETDADAAFRAGCKAWHRSGPPAVEGGLGAFAPSILRTLPIAGAAGVLGLAAAVAGSLRQTIRA